MKQCNIQTIIVPLHRGRFVVVHIYSGFSMEPSQDLPFGANIFGYKSAHKRPIP